MTGRRAAFDPSRLDDEFDDLLPPPPTRPHLRPAPEPNPAQPSPSDLDGQPRQPASTPAIPPPRAPRGGGRPAGRANQNPASTSVVAVRIPTPLYDAVVRDLLAGLVERPSYAQIVAWTCEDHTDDVVAELTRAATTTARTPRGRKLASDGVPLTLRFQPEERDALDDVIREAGEGAIKITRTAGVAAALRVAVKHGLPATSTHN